MKKFLIYLILLLQTFFAATALAAPNLPPKPSISSGIYVQDYAGVLTQEDKQKILHIGQELDKQTSAQAAVVTVDTLNGEPIEDYALALLRHWGIGTKEQNNGVLILIAVKDRQSRIEVGYGLEGVLPDGLTGRIQDNYMLPFFRKGNYSQGILQGYMATAKIIANSQAVNLKETNYQSSAVNKQVDNTDDVALNRFLLIIAIIALLIIDNIFLGGFFTNLLLLMLFRHGGGGGGGYGGGFGGGSGGSGGGGGSSRHW